MKLSSIILLATFILLVTAMFASNVLLKKEYDKLDKSDIYWTYGKILDRPFRHLKIQGGNLTRIAFEQSKNYSVRVFKNWEGYDQQQVKAFVAGDTLFVRFPQDITNPYQKRYMGWNTLVRIFSPELLSVSGFNTNFELNKLKQKQLTVDLSGRSKLEVESSSYEMDSIRIEQKDSSEVIFEMSPELKGRPLPAIQQMAAAHGSGSNSWETMFVKSADVHVQGVSVLDIGHLQIDSLQLHIADTSGIILSGRNMNKYLHP